MQDQVYQKLPKALQERVTRWDCTEEKYKVQTPETMQETFMSDSEDELGKK